MLKGCAVSGGFAVGKIVKIGEKKHSIRRNTYLGKEAETERFERALGEVTRKTQEVCARIRRIVGEEEANIFQGHIYMAQDPEMGKDIREKIARGFNAEMAAESACNVYIERFLAAPHALTNQRAADVRDVKHAFLNSLCAEEQAPPMIPFGSVIAAAELTPSAVSFLERRRTVAVLTAEGDKNAHLAVLLRAMGIPAVFSVENLMQTLKNGQKVMVDGNAGEVIEIVI